MDIFRSSKLKVQNDPIAAGDEGVIICPLSELVESGKQLFKSYSHFGSNMPMHT